MAQGRILIVEDEILVAESVREKLLGLGYEVLDVVAFGEKAVNVAVELQPDLILMDIKLAGEMDGITAAEQIRAVSDVPIVYLTAYADAETLQRAKVAEPFGYLLKPFRIGDLRSTVEMALYKHEMEKKVNRLAKFPAESPTPVFRVSNDGMVLYANRASVPLLNMWQCRVDAHLPGDWCAFVKKVFDSGSSGETEVECGERVWALTFTPVRDAGYLNVYGIDVTDRKRAEEELRKLSRAVEQSPSIVVITDTQGNIEYVNPTFTRLTGYMDGEVIGQNPRILKSGQQAPEIYTQLWDTILAGGEWRGEFCNRKKSEEIYWELASISPIRNTAGAITHFLKVAEDITERKRAEEALEWEVTVNTVVAELSRTLLSFVSLEEVSHFVLEQAKYLTSSEFGYVGYIDPESGYLVCPTMSRKVQDVYQVEAVGVVFKTFKGLWGRVLNRRQSLLTNEPLDEPHSSNTPLGNVSIQRFLSAPAMIGTKVVGQVALANADHDYTKQDLALAERLADLYALALQRHWAQAALRQRTLELQAHNEELDAFAHTVAHDLKNPLGVIVGFSETLEDAYAAMSPEELREYLHIIAWNSHKMSNIVDELLLLAGVRKVKVERVPLDMVSIVVEAQQRLVNMIEEYQAEIVVEPATWPMALGHAPWIEEVWVNFLSNAIKYGGRPPRVELGFDPSAGTDKSVHFWVRDNGPGLSPEEQARLFVPFTQLAQVRAEGHGLGLSIVRRIVEKLGGQVGVESSGVSGKGCLFSFTLPGVSREE